jgi:hypothetical protein
MCPDSLQSPSGDAGQAQAEMGHPGGKSYGRAARGPSSLRSSRPRAARPLPRAATHSLALGKCHPCARTRVLPMCQVAQERDRDVPGRCSAETDAGMARFSGRQPHFFAEGQVRGRARDDDSRSRERHEGGRAEDIATHDHWEHPTSSERSRAPPSWSTALSSLSARLPPPASARQLAAPHSVNVPSPCRDMHSPLPHLSSARSSSPT